MDIKVGVSDGRVTVTTESGKWHLVGYRRRSECLDKPQWLFVRNAWGFVPVTQPPMTEVEAVVKVYGWMFNDPLSIRKDGNHSWKGHLWLPRV